MEKKYHEFSVNRVRDQGGGPLCLDGGGLPGDTGWATRMHRPAVRDH